MPTPVSPSAPAAAPTDRRLRHGDDFLESDALDLGEPAARPLRAVGAVLGDLVDLR